MRILFIRLLSWLSGFAAVFAAWRQWSDPLSYPLPLMCFLVWMIFAIILMSWHRTTVLTVLEKMAPAILVQCACIFACVMADSQVQKMLFSVSLALCAFIPLELFFFFLYDGKRYPVNGLSHVNIAFVPLAVFFTTIGLNGTRVFLRAPWWATVLVLVVSGIALFALTEHPTADIKHRRRWRILGAFIGLHAALFVLILPFNVWVHGVLAAILFSVPLRLRRYAYAPQPPMRMAWTEGAIAVIVFLFLLLTSQWA